MARKCTRLPSSSINDAPTPLHNSCARRTISSNTGCVSSGVLDITFSTSIVADCCSISFAELAVALRQSLGPFAQFAQQPRVLHRDHRLGGKVLQQALSPFSENARTSCR